MGIRRVVAAVDTGQVVNPDGVRNQVEGGILQGTSWTLFERVTFDRTRVTSVDWSAYPILRFGDVPDSVEVHIIDRPGDIFFGVAEAAQGPSGAALANAIRARLVSDCATYRSPQRGSRTLSECDEAQST